MIVGIHFIILPTFDFDSDLKNILCFNWSINIGINVSKSVNAKTLKTILSKIMEESHCIEITGMFVIR